MAEWLIGAMEFPDRRRQFVGLSTPSGPANRATFVAACRAANAENSSVVPQNTKGDDWHLGEWPRTLYDHAIPINGPNCIPAVIDDLAGTCAAGSLHPGGANVLLADGHASFIKESIDMEIWRSLGTRNGGEVIGTDQF
jgi:prepilin-type processing-associated H-X9-DG protein